MGEPKMTTNTQVWVVSGIVAFGLTGCGESQYHQVTGRVTLNGEPLADALISFISEGEGSSFAVGKTDSDGNYVLKQSQDIHGIEVGMYKVRITTFSEGDLSADPPSPPVPEKVPPKYNLETELIVEVVATKNVFDFELEWPPPKRPWGRD